jgi:pimeloyl-ACP methyl ester carboxylesterase
VSGTQAFIGSGNLIPDWLHAEHYCEADIQTRVTMKKAYVDVPMGQIHYLFAGSGRSLVLLHQLPLSSDEYREMIPTIGKHFQALCMDIPGYGKSDEPDRYYEIGDYAECVIQFLDALNIDKASMVGTHSGAAIAVEAAAAYPGRVDRLILNGCPFHPPEVRKARLADSRYAPMEVKEDGSHLARIWETAKGWSPNADPLSWHRWVVDYLISGRRDAHKALFRYEIEKRLPLIQCPTLLIYGTEDIFYGRREQTKNLITDGSTRIIQGGGFILGYERPGEFLEAILEFL